MAAAASVAPAVAPTDLTKLFATIQKSVSALNTSVQAFEKDVSDAASNESADNPFAYPDGISLLTVKNDAMLDYLHHVVAVCISKISGRSLAASSSSSSTSAKVHAAQAPADLVQNLVKLRLMLEKLRPLENRLKYQMDKLLRAAADADKEVLLGRAKPAKATKSKSNGEGSGDDAGQDDDGSDDDLAFRPNPSAFMQDKARTLAKSSKSNGTRSKSHRDSSPGSESDDEGGKTAVYRPPKLVPMSYDPDARSNKKGEKSSSITRNSALLSDLTASMSSNPYEASSAGVGVGGRGRLASNTSSRAKALARMEEFEEENFTRLVMSKKDARKRRRDEADVALGGAGLSSGRDGRRRIGGGMEEEFGDLLRGAGLDGRNGKKAKKAQQAYDTLRASSKAGSTLQRSKSNAGGAPSAGGSRSNKFKNQVNRSARR